MGGRADPCAGCVYRARPQYPWVCNYSDMEGRFRIKICPLGAGCVVKETEDEMKKWDKARAYELYQAGAADKEIAAEVEVEPGTIYKWRRARGLAAHMPARQTLPADTGSGPEPEPPELEAAEPQTPQDSGTQADGDGPEGTREDGSGPEGTSPGGPVELHLELGGGWVRLRAPDWQTGRKLCNMMGVLVCQAGVMWCPNE